MTSSTIRPAAATIFLASIILLILPVKPASASTPADARGAAGAAALRLVQFCVDPASGLDERAVAVLGEYVLGTKPERGHALPSAQASPGAYHEFDAKISFPRFLDYSYNPLLSSVVTRPSSLRYSLWTGPKGAHPPLPGIGRQAPSAGSPFVFHGMQRDSNTPDLTTGVYYEYDLKRTLIMANHKGRPILISVCKQVRTSNVGGKGFIIGDDQDWNYYYSGEAGSAATGLGWVKSYIYDYFSVSIHAEQDAGRGAVRTGVLQWIRAGWSGINFVQTGHIIEGMKRFARSNAMILESPRLPPPNQMILAARWLSNLPPSALQNQYADMQREKRSAAERVGKIDKAEGNGSIPYADAPREQKTEELMLEYLKWVLGKATSVGNRFALLLPPSSSL